MKASDNTMFFLYLLHFNEKFCNLEKSRQMNADYGITRLYPLHLTRFFFVCVISESPRASILICNKLLATLQKEFTN